MVDNPFPISFENLAPYVEKCAEYFGFLHDGLRDMVFFASSGPKYENADMPDGLTDEESIVTWDALRQEFNKYFPAVDDDKEKECLLILWLIANTAKVGELDKYEAARQDFEFSEFPDYYSWKPIKDELIRLYSFLSMHRNAMTITISVKDWALPGGMKTEGNKLVTYSEKFYEHIMSNKSIMDSWGDLGIKPGSPMILEPDEFRWFHALAFNHIFPKCIPEIQTVDDAERYLAPQKTGPKEKSRDIKPIIAGTAKLFRDAGLLKDQRAPKELCEFIIQLLVKMGLIADADPKWDVNRIGVEIAHAQDGYEKLPDRAIGTKEFGLDALKDSDNPNTKLMDWLFARR